VSFAGKVEDQNPAELLRSLARAAASGKLTFTRREGHAVLAFRSGRIVYAASSALRETFGNILVLRGLVSEADLLQALERQHRAKEPVRLGDVLVAMGKVDDKALREVMRQRTEEVIAELVRWKSGFFQFEPLPLAAGGEIEVDDKDFLRSEGFSPQEMLGDTAPPVSPPARPAPPGGETPPPGFPHFLASSASPALTPEVTLRLLRYASQILSRGVLFAVRGEELRGMGEFGVQVVGRSAAEQVRETVVPLGEPSVLRDVVEKRETFRGPLPDSRWSRHLVHRLGGQEPSEVVIVPMIVGRQVAALFYGDNVPDLRPIGPVDTLEFMVAETAAAMEQAPADSRERSRPERKPDRGGA
jgi:hypothetical protein